MAPTRSDADPTYRPGPVTENARVQHLKALLDNPRWAFQRHNILAVIRWYEQGNKLSRQPHWFVDGKLCDREPEWDGKSIVWVEVCRTSFKDYADVAYTLFRSSSTALCNLLRARCRYQDSRGYLGPVVLLQLQGNDYQMARSTRYPPMPPSGMHEVHQQLPSRK